MALTTRGTLEPPSLPNAEAIVGPPERGPGHNSPPADLASTNDSVTPTSIQPNWATYISFTDTAGIRPYSSYKRPSKCTPVEVNDDLCTGPYQKSTFTWAGEQRKGLASTITDAQSPADHVQRAVNKEFPLAKDIPLPSELTEALDFIQPGGPDSIRAFWKSSGPGFIP